MDRRKIFAAWAIGVASTLSIVVFTGLKMAGQQDPKKAQEAKDARDDRKAQQESADRTVGYDPQNYLGFDPQAFFVPPRVTEVRVEERHALKDCALEFAGSASDVTDATLFASPGQRIGLGPVFGDQGFHAHVIADGKDKVYRPDDRGNLIIESGAAPARVILVTTPFTIDYPSAKVFIPPYTMSLRVMDAAQMVGIVSAQPFARAIKPTEDAPADLFVATMPRSDNEFVFAAYDLSGKRTDLESGLWLCASQRYILQPTFRAWVESAEGKLTQKVEILPFPPNVGFAAAGTDTFDLETLAGPMAKIAVPPRPHIDAPDTTVEPLPNVNVTATFYGFPKTGSYRVVTGQGCARIGKPQITVDQKETASELTYQVTSLTADRDSDNKPVPRSAFYSLRVNRKWEKEGGRVGASIVTALPPSILGDRAPFVPTTKLLHAKIVRLGGAGGAPVASDYNPLMAGILADAGVRSALGLRELAKPSKGKGGSGTTVVVNNYINTEGTGGGMMGGGSMNNNNNNITVNSGGGGESDWMGRWAYERYQATTKAMQEGAKDNPYNQQNMQFGHAGRSWNGAPLPGKK